MQLTHIELSRLSVSKANMRYGTKAPDISNILPSVRARGVLVPLLVRPNGPEGMYEIVAGSRRYHAALAVEAEGGGLSALPCAVMEQGDDAAALEASLLENIARLDPDDVSQWETFSRLVREGRSAGDTATTFGLTEQTVRRVLALGNLLPAIRTLYRKGEIDPVTVRHLTLASRPKQQEWLALVRDPDARAPTGGNVKHWLFGGAVDRHLRGDLSARYVRGPDRGRPVRRGAVFRGLRGVLDRPVGSCDGAARAVRGGWLEARQGA